MTEQEKLARQWAEEYQNDWPKFTPGTRAAELVEKAKAAAEYILEHTSPPTMTDVDWDDEKHYLRHGKVIMLSQAAVTGNILVIFYEDGERNLVYAIPEYLTPNGKRYKLVEATVSSGENVGSDQPDHPEVLRTVEDYENAPKGTIVSSEGCYPYAKSHSGEWIALGDNATNEEMAVDQLDRRVLRWGWD